MTLQTSKALKNHESYLRMIFLAKRKQNKTATTIKTKQNQKTPPTKFKNENTFLALPLPPSVVITWLEGLGLQEGLRDCETPRGCPSP